MKTRTLIVPLAAAAALAAAPTAAAQPQPFGGHVSSCAQAHLGQRPDPPTVTCEHDGHLHTFATFGEMVRHMQAH
ncbi:MAG: hypothetical protein IT431_07235 [Phycisphaerales bacterium]|nr:hypothetical protein [Phycisphaerales bacterium]